MADNSEQVVPVWALATDDVRIPEIPFNSAMTPQRLADLRQALAALAEHPVATLEVHRLPADVDRNFAIPLGAASPLAQHLTQLISNSSGTSKAAASAAESGEMLYRMVVPSKFAGALAKGIVRPMQSKAVPGAIRGGIVGSSGIVAQSSFVPVAEAGAMGTAAGAAGAAGATVAGGTALTVAAPLVLMAVAVAASAAVEHQRQMAIDHITDLLEDLHDQLLDAERSELGGCRDAVDKATAILLDQGKLSVSLGLDSAVHSISKALDTFDRRLEKWQTILENFPTDKPVEIDTIVEEFPGIDEPGGKFRAQIEIAMLAIALKRRVIVLQAVEAAQMDPGNSFENFMNAISADQKRLIARESGIAEVLITLSKLELGRPRGWRNPVFTPGDVDRLLRQVDQIRALGSGVTEAGQDSDVAVEIIRESDGSVLVFPAFAA